MPEPRFEPIGPFDLTRIDQLVAANAISFIVGSPRSRAFSALLLTGGTGFSIWSAAIGDSGGVVAGILFATLIFVLTPLLRSNVRSRDIVISGNSEGLQIETGAVRTLCKRDRLGEARVVARRLLVGIGGNCFLIIPARATTSENLARLLVSIAR